MSTSTMLNSTYVAINLQGILYGVGLALYFETIHAVLTMDKKQRSDISLLLFSTVTLILITVWVSATGVLGEETWVIHGAISPANSYAYFLSAFIGWYMVLARVGIYVLQLMTDALLIHRCRAIWNSSVVIIFPLILWVACLALTILQSWQLITFAPDHPYSRTSVFTVLSYYVVCVVLNTTLTSLICYRLIRHGKRIHSELGREFSSVYFAAAGLIVESALPFTLCGIASSVMTGLSTDFMTPFIWGYFMMAYISPQMLILRVLRNKNLPRNMGESASTGQSIRFHQWSEVSVPEGGDDEPKGSLRLLPLTRIRSASPNDHKG